MLACVSITRIATRGNIIELGGADFELVEQRPAYGAGAEAGFCRRLLYEDFGRLAFAGTAFVCWHAFHLRPIATNRNIIEENLRGENLKGVWPRPGPVFTPAGPVGLGKGWAIGSLAWRRALAKEHAARALSTALPRAERMELREASWRANLAAGLAESGGSEDQAAQAIVEDRIGIASATAIRGADQLVGRQPASRRFGDLEGLSSSCQTGQN